MYIRVLCCTLLLLVGIHPEMSVRYQRPQVACIHPCYVNETLTLLALRSCSLICAPVVTVLGLYNPLFRTPDIGACFEHTQNSRRCFAINAAVTLCCDQPATFLRSRTLKFITKMQLNCLK